MIGLFSLYHLICVKIVTVGGERVKDFYRLERKDNLVFWISKWNHGEHTEEQLRAKPIDELQRIYNHLLAEKTSKVI